MKPARASSKLVRLLVATMLALSILATSGSLSAGVAHAEGSRDLYRSGATGFRANLEWRTSFYGPPTGSSAGFLLRRTFLQVYAEPGEVLLMGSSAVGVGAADIVLYSSDQVTVPPIGDEGIGAPAFSCEAQRTGPGGLPGQGQITSRAQELAGPDTVPAGGVPGGFVPCYYEVPAEGIYYVAFYGPEGPDSNEENFPSGRIDLITGNPLDFGPGQNTSVSAWDVTVRDSLTSTDDITGRLFADYLAMITGGSNRPVYSTLYALTTDAYIYQVDLRGLDPYGFVLYANNRGFLDSDANTPLFHDVLAEDIPPLTNPQQQNQLELLQGGVSFAKPTHHIFFNEPSPEAIEEVNDGRVDPVKPEINPFYFEGVLGGNETLPGAGGTFVLNFNIRGIWRLIISRDGVDFDPDNPANRTFTGVGGPSPEDRTIDWDGLDNAGNEFGEPGNTYWATIQLRGGEVHFPLLDVENSQDGGPEYQLINAPDGCPELTGGCFAGFYDDRGYITFPGLPDGTPVGEPGDVLPCPEGNPGCNPPATPVSDPINGFDTRSSDRAFGDGSQAGFGDKKGLDVWTYYPAERITPIVIPQQTDLRIDKDHDIPCYKPGESQIVNYTIDYENVGDEPAVDATVTDTLPGATTFVSCSGAPCNEISPGVVEYSLGTLDPGETGSLGLTARVDDDATGTLTNTALIEAVDVPAVGATDDDGLDLCTIRISMSSGCYCPGERERITFNIKYANEGIEPALDATVTDTLPEAMTFVPSRSDPTCNETSPGVVVCSLGDLAAGEKGQLELTVRVADDATGRLRNRARLEATNFDPARATYVPKLCCNGNGNGTIPEPTTLALVGLGLAGLAGYARRRRQRRAD